MKKINIILVFLLSLSCYSQTISIEQIIDIEDSGGQEIQGAYYKDVNNLLDPFIGTYIFNNGDKYFKIVLEKRIHSSLNGFCYSDTMIAEYQYIVNGIEKTNTLNKLTINYSDARFHTIDGDLLYTGKVNGCYDCDVTEKRLRMGIFDNYSKAGGDIIIRRIIVGGQPAIELNLNWNTRIHREGTPLPLQPELKGGDYIMIKE
ncbi:DUF6705 family protein [Flavobacterium sp.]|uniref:DUF6705 family protein n=1 Tax=Flavobacterium sp. TaxID=239 RepID=UPI0037526560